MKPIEIQQGTVIIYRVFDIGNCVDIELAAKTLEDMSPVRKIRLNRKTRSVLISEHPIQLTLGVWSETMLGQAYEIECEATLWSFGSLSLAMKFKIEPGLPIDKLCELSHYIENEEPLHKTALSKANWILDLIGPAVERPGIWKEFEDYTIFAIKSFCSPPKDLKKFFADRCFAELVLGEKPHTFADGFAQSLEPNMCQYSANDLVLIHWNAAIVYDADDSRDICYTLEFALCQMLVLRYYDNLLDQQLQALYHQIDKTKTSILSNPYRELSKKAALEYIDMSEVVDRVENAFKVIGEFYFAMVYNLATKKFHLSSWKESVNHKLENLAEVSKLFQGEINEKRAQWMEFTIVVLIAIEVIPFVYSLLN